MSVDSDAIDSGVVSHNQEVLDSDVSLEDDDDIVAPVPHIDSSRLGDDPQNAEQQQHGSSLAGAVFNFTNSIIGAGCIGLGGAIAVSGGAISIILILFFGVLTKISLDMVIRLSVETEGARGSYEDLASVGLGLSGRWLVMGCKFLYSFGCLVAYIIVVKDNFASALRSLLFSKGGPSGEGGILGWLYYILQDHNLTTWAMSFAVILPLCLLRDMTPLANLSMMSVVSMISIVFIVIYIYFEHPEMHVPEDGVYVNWFEVRPGVLESLGTFVFTFVSQHTVHLVYGSLRPAVRNVPNWKIVSTTAITVSSMVSLSVGIFVYMTFWSQTQSDIFAIYPDSWMIDLAKLLLCITMLFTFPLPFFTCRELVIVMFIHPCCKNQEIEVNDELLLEDGNNLRQPLIMHTDSRDENDSMSLATLSRLLHAGASPNNWLLEGDDRQLQTLGHMVLTAKLWFVTTALAIASPNLGDVLDLVGCASGTMIAFVLPSVLSLRIEGYSHVALLVLLVGGVVGTVGTFYSVKKLIADM